MFIRITVLFKIYINTVYGQNFNRLDAFNFCSTVYIPNPITVGTAMGHLDQSQL